MEQTVELLKNAIEAEVRAQVFYAKAAELTNDDESRMVFLKLVGMEQKHAQYLVDHFASGPIAAAVDLQAYLDEVEADTEKLLDVVETPFVQNGTIEQVLDFAVHQEHKARDNYLSLAAILEDPQDRQRCTQLAEEEQQHAAQLEQLRLSLDMDNEERPGL